MGKETAASITIAVPAFKPETRGNWFMDNFRQIVKGGAALLGLALLGGAGYWLRSSAAKNGKESRTVEVGDNGVALVESNPPAVDTGLLVSSTDSSGVSTQNYSVAASDEKTSAKVAAISSSNAMPELTANQLTIAQGMSAVLTTGNLNAYNPDDPTGDGLLRTLYKESSPTWVRNIVFNPAGDKIASVDYVVRIWNVADGSLVRKLDRGYCMAFNPTGDKIVSGYWGGESLGSIKIWNVADGSLLRTMTGHTNYINSVAFSPTGDKIVSGSSDGTVKIWNVVDGALVRTLTGHTSNVNSAVFSPAGDLIASGSDDHSIKIWNTTDGLLLKTLIGYTSFFHSVAFNPAGNKIISGDCGDNSIKIWNVADGLLLNTLTGHKDCVYSVALNLAGDKIVSAGGYDNSIKLWDSAAGSLLRTLTGHESPYTVTFNPTGDRLVSGGWGCTAMIWTTQFLSFTVSNVRHGNFKRAGVVVNTFALQEVKDGVIHFVHDGSINAPGYMVAVSNGAATTAPVAATIHFTTPTSTPAPSSENSNGVETALIAGGAAVGGIFLTAIACTYWNRAKHRRATQRSEELSRLLISDKEQKGAGDMAVVTKTPGLSST